MNADIKRLVVLTYTEEEFRQAREELDSLCGRYDDEDLNEMAKKIDIWISKYFYTLV